MTNSAEIKQKITDISKQAFKQGLFAATSGNLSYCVHGEGKIYITPTSVRYETMTADDIAVISFDGTQCEGERAPSSEWRMHAEIYKNKPEVNAVFHTHSPYASAFATVYMAIPTILVELQYFLGGEVRVAEHKQIGTADVGTAALVALRDRYACLLGSHGVLTVGDTLDQALIRAEYVEDAAKIYHYALQIGTPRVLNSGGQ